MPFSSSTQVQSPVTPLAGVAPTLPTFSADASAPAHSSASTADVSAALTATGVAVNALIVSIADRITAVSLLDFDFILKNLLLLD